MKTVDVGAVIDEGRWTGYQKLLIFGTALTIILDGVDNQLLPNAVPTLIREWGRPRADFINALTIGPFGMMDMIGLDVVRDIEMVYYRESGDPSDAPPRCLVERIQRGELGVKTGKGFYRYPDPAYKQPAFLRTPDPGQTGPKGPGGRI
ncbi:MAG: hypothetical protein EHM89_17650 [Acidobacteria bacterium]|nr:MAG: hypothetical protein EHM89_17650 [Acidobacteriota bacterium]